MKTLRWFNLCAYAAAGGIAVVASAHSDLWLLGVAVVLISAALLGSNLAMWMMTGR